MPWWSGWRKLPEVKTAPVCRVWVLFRTAGTEWSLEDELGLLRQRIHFTHSPGILDPSDSMNALQILTCNSTAHLTFAQYIRQHVHEINSQKRHYNFKYISILIHIYIHIEVHSLRGLKIHWKIIRKKNYISNFLPQNKKRCSEKCQSCSFP